MARVLPPSNGGQARPRNRRIERARHP